MTRTTTTGTSVPAWPKDAIRISFGLIWLVDAVLKWLPGFRSGYLDGIKGAGQGQPGWLHWWFSFWTNLQTPEPMFFAYLVAVIETLIAVAVIFGFARKLTYISGAVFSLMVWATAEGFGGPYISGSADIGTAVIYAGIFVALLALMLYVGPARYSVDYYLEQKFSWWWTVAELRRPVQEQPALAAGVPAEPATGTRVTSVVPAQAGPMGPAGPAGLALPVLAGVDGDRPEPVVTH